VQPWSLTHGQSTEVAPQQTILRRLTPGVVAGAADLDPAAVLTATVAGASFGYAIGWVVLLLIPILWTVLTVSARIGQQTNKGLVELVRDAYGKKSAIGFAVCIAAVNMVMIIGDLMAVSDAAALILNQPRKFFLALSAFMVWYILMRAEYRRVIRALVWLSLLLLAYVVAAALATSSVTDLVRGLLIPKFPSNPAYTLAVVALFGSLLTPDILVWQASSRKDHAQSGGAFYQSESRAGCAIAALVSLSAVVAASVLRVPDPTRMTTRAAAEALAPLGELGPIIFSIGIIGSGMVALPIIVASMCFSIAEAAGWKSGLSKAPWEARGFYILIGGILLLAVVTNFFGINTVKVVYSSQILAGIVVIPTLTFILLLANNRRLMKETSTLAQNFWLGGAIGGMVMANMVFLWLRFLV
jgi:Mn2+/Fe2+ NRAMP family transporter